MTLAFSFSQALLDATFFKKKLEDMIKIVIYDQVSIYEASLECLGRTQAGETSGDFRQDLQPSGVACS